MGTSMCDCSSAPPTGTWCCSPFLTSPSALLFTPTCLVIPYLLTAPHLHPFSDSSYPAAPPWLGLTPYLVALSVPRGGSRAAGHPGGPGQGGRAIPGVLGGGA